jgi:hypothetical protein
LKSQSGVVERKASRTIERIHGHDRVPPDIFKSAPARSTMRNRARIEDARARRIEPSVMDIQTDG